MFLVSCRSTEELIRRRDEAFLRHFAVPALPAAARASLVPHHLVSVVSPSDFRLAEEKVTCSCLCTYVLASVVLQGGDVR